MTLFADRMCLTSAAHHPVPGTNCSVPVAYCRTRSFPIELLQ